MDDAKKIPTDIDYKAEDNTAYQLIARRKKMKVNLGRVWYLIVSIPDLCTLTNFV